jgi:hypothetical protein
MPTDEQDVSFSTVTIGGQWRLTVRWRMRERVVPALPSHGTGHGTVAQDPVSR